MLKRKCMAQFMVPTIQTWVSPPPWSLSIPTSTWPPSAPSSSYASLGSGIYTYMDISNTNVHSPARRECDRHRVEQHHARLKSSARTGTDNAVRIEQILVSPHNAQPSPFHHLLLQETFLPHQIHMMLLQVLSPPSTYTCWSSRSSLSTCCHHNHKMLFQLGFHPHHMLYQLVVASHHQMVSSQMTIPSPIIMMPNNKP